MDSMRVLQLVVEIAWAVGLFLMVGCLFSAYGIGAAWLVADARKRGHSGVGWICVYLCLTPLVLLVWLFVRPNTLLTERTPDDYRNPEDALAAASYLDQQGEWNAAVALYESIADRWPDNERYVQACVKDIEAKQRLGPTIVQ